MIRNSIASKDLPIEGGLSEKFDIVSPRQYADGSTRRVDFATTHSEDGASSSSTLKQKIPAEEPDSRNSPTSQTTQSDPVRSERVHGVPEAPNMPDLGHFEYASHKVVPFTTVKQLGHGSLGSVDAVRHSGDTDGVILARKVIRLPNMARKRLLPLIQQKHLSYESSDTSTLSKLSVHTRPPPRHDNLASSFRLPEMRTWATILSVYARMTSLKPTYSACQSGSTA